LGFFSKDKSNKGIIEKRILDELKDFSNTYDSLEKIKAFSKQSFGENWKEELTKLVSSQSNELKEVLSQKLNQFLDYEIAVDCYKKATKFIHLDFILNNNLYEAKEIVKSKDLIISSLSKFGGSGSDLKDKFKEKLDEFSNILHHEEDEKVEEISLEISQENDTKEPYSEEVIAVKPKEVQIAEEKLPEPANKRNILSKEENSEHLSSFQEKVRVAKIKDNINRSYSTAGQSLEIKEETNDHHVNGLEWNIRHLYTCEEYYKNSQNILSLVAVENKAKSLEEYKHYPLLIDLSKHIIKTINKVLAEKSSENYRSLLSKYKGDDARTPEEMLSYYTEQVKENSDSLNNGGSDFSESSASSELSDEIKKQVEQLKMVA
jgi:hypothetical protein